MSDGQIIEEIPIVGNSFATVYRNDGQGAGSTNTGFFVQFKQGSLDSGQFSVTNPSTNQAIDIDATNINDKDVWLFKLNNQGQEVEYWTKVDAVEGNNVIHNSSNKKHKKLICSKNKSVPDRISLVFSDGVFGNLPKEDLKQYIEVVQPTI